MADKLHSGQLVLMMKNSATREQGFRMLMSQYGRSLYWHIRRIVVSHDDAEDALQETSIKIFENIQNFKGESQLSTWLYRVATNEALKQLRSHTGIFQSIDSLGEQLTDRLMTETSLDGNDAELLMQKALLTLPTQQRIAFNLRYYDELPYEEIATITGKNVGTLKTNYHIAKQKITDYIKQHSA